MKEKNQNYSWFKNVMKKFIVTEENDKYDKYVYEAIGNNKITLEQSLSKWGTKKHKLLQNQ